MLNGTNRKLEKKLNTSFENSSLPSSALPFRKKISNRHRPTDRKPSHKPHNASRLLTTKAPIHLPAPDEFLNNPDIYLTGKTITKQLIDIRVCVQVQDFIADVYRNRSAGTRLHATFLPGIVNDVTYGASVNALAFLLNNYYNVSISKS